MYVNVFSQVYPATFSNYEIKDSLIINDVSFYWDEGIKEIILNSDKEFTFAKRPTISCFTWKDYKGKWKLENDTILFTDQIEIKERDVVFSFSNDNEFEYKIKFKTDRGAKLYNKQIEIEFIYDFDSKLKNFKIKKELDNDFNLKIPFNEVPNRKSLASIKYDYLFRKDDKRNGYITESQVLNRKEKELQNNIQVIIIEKPRKETILRTTKGILKENKIIIITSEKSKSTLVDYSDELYFKDFYIKN